MIRLVLAGLVVLTLSGCGPETGSAQACSDRMLENLHRGEVSLGYPQPECSGLTDTELREVDQKVADAL